MYKCDHCQRIYDKSRSLSAHRCKNRELYIQNLYQKNKSEILTKYNEGYSILEISKEYQLTHVLLDRYLRKDAIPLRTQSQRNNKRIQEKTKITWLKNWGVDNPSKLSDIKDKKIKTLQDKYGVNNSTDTIVSRFKHYIIGTGPDPDKENDYHEYRNIVETLTNQNKKLLPSSPVCYYSRVKIGKGIHFNKPLYATLDHKISIWEGFEKGILPEIIGSINNLVWCARIMNQYKRTMSENQFRNSGIIERFIKYVDKIS